MRRLLKFGWRYRARSLQVFGCQVLLLAMALAGVRLMGLAVDVIRYALDPSAPEPLWPPGLGLLGSFSTLWVLGAVGFLVLMFAVGGALLNYGYSVLVGRLVHEEMVPGLRSELYRKLQRLGFRFFDTHPSGSIINRVTRDVQMLRSFVDGVVIQGAVLVLSLGVFLAYMLHTHVWLTLVSMALTPLLYLATMVFSRWARPAYLKNRELSDQMVRVMTESIEGVQVLKVFGREPEQNRRFTQSNLALRSQQQHIFRQVSRFTPMVDLLNHLNLAILMGYGAVLIARREITLGDLIVFAGLLQQFAARATNMANIVNTLQQSLTGARRVFEVLDQPLGVQQIAAPRHIGRLRGQVSFENVSFDYHPGAPALHDVSFNVEPGECIGILGATGSGKSTLLSLIPRFYDPTAGRVCIDGVDVRELSLDELRARIGIVFQETLLFRDTVAGNIAFGRPEATQQQIAAAAERAGAAEFVAELPNGYQTLLEEGAHDLSGGQRQRLAIARALLLAPEILILDDPTAAIDVETEERVLRAIDSAILGRTTFLVSGRISSLCRADRIVVLEAGRIVEQGTHQELLARGGVYSATARLQGVQLDHPVAPSAGEVRA